MIDTLFQILGIIFALIVILAIVGVKTGVIKITRDDK